MASCATCLHKNVHPNVCSDCLCGTHFKPRIKTKTNGDRLRAMSDEELAEMMAHDNCGYCKIHDYCFSQKGIECDEAWLGWLREKAE